MVFTERQKVELKNISKEMSKEILTEFINDNLFMDVLAKKIADLVAKKVDEHIEKLAMKINLMETEIKNIQGENEELKLRVVDLEQKSKLNELRIYGMPEDNTCDLSTKIKEVFELKLRIKDITIEKCYRTGLRKNIKSNKPRSIIIKFSNIEQRNSVFFNKKNKNSMVASL